MLLKTESFNQVRQERETLRKDYKQMAQIAHDRDVQVASLGALASEVTALYGLRQNKLTCGCRRPMRSPRPLPQTLALTDDVTSRTSNSPSISSTPCATQAMSGRVTRALRAASHPP